MVEKLYLVAQDIDCLYGEYFVRAVVIAKSKDEALGKVENQIKDWNDDPERDDKIQFIKDRIKVFELGKLERRPDGSELGINQSRLDREDILAIEISEDWEF